MLDYSFLARRAIMPLIWCGCFARSRAGKGSTNYIFVGEASIRCRHGAERALCSLDCVDVGDMATLRSGNTPPRWMFPPSARSHLLLRVRYVGADGHLMVMKCASPTKMDTFHLEQATPCAKAPRQISCIVVRLEEHRYSSTSLPPLPAGSPPKEPPPRRRRQGPRRGEIARGRARASPCRQSAPRRAQEPPCTAISTPPPRRRRPPRASGPRRCVKTCTRQMPTGESTTSAAPCAPKTVGSASERASGWLGDSPPRPARPAALPPRSYKMVTLLQRAPLAQPSAPKTLVVWAAYCSILEVFSRGSCPQRVR